MRKVSDNRRWRIAYNMYEDNVLVDSVGKATSDSPKTGWGFFSEEISFFLCEFYRRRLNPMEKLMFYCYYINGMNLEEIAERVTGPRQTSKFKHEGENDEDDEIIGNPDKFHVSHQAVHKVIEEINRKLKHEWQYSDRWED